MNELLKQAIDVLRANLGAKSIGLLMLCLCAVYMWYQHFRNRILKDQIEFEKERREDFLRQVVELQKNPNPCPTVQANREHVLVVDDELMVCRLIASCLERQDPSIEVETATDGREALDKVASKKPSILITDIVMPGIGGVDLLKILQSKGIRIPTLVISGYYDELSDALLSGYEIPPDQRILFLSKPFRTEDLQRAVANLRHPGTGKVDSKGSHAPRTKKLRG